jgi:outer membrane lipoprotein-sorting protein
LGGDTVKGHRGGLLGGVHMTLDIHNHQVTTLRGDTVDESTIGSMLGDFTPGKGGITQAAGPLIDGSDTVAVTLDVADAAANNGVSRDVLYLSEESHLPVRRERYSGATLVKTENVTDMKTNIGLTASDFPW